MFALSIPVAAWQMKQGPLMTQWDSQIDTNAPLPEYPRPQMVRSNWLNLNGIWQFQPGITNTDPVPTNHTLSSSILVPYPMESAISGVMQYSAWSWYRTLFAVPSNWSGNRILLHLDAVNWQSTVYINGSNIGTHKGGYDPITYDITPYLKIGSNELIVQVFSPEDNGSQPRGKQTLSPGGIMYTSSSGIWQPAWLEPIDPSGVANLVIVPDIDNSRLRLIVNTLATSGVTVSVSVLDNGVVTNTAVGNPNTELDIPLHNPKLWSPSSPFLYGLQINTIHNGVTNDSVSSYFGMRKISVATNTGVPQIFLNNQFLFEMGPLDQGFWPDGIYTAPTDDALKFDLQEEKALGFNTVRKHIKVERPRWYYWADTLGLMIWQDMPSCNSYTGNPNPPAIDPIQFEAELTAMVTNHWNNPCIIMWDIFNEGQGEAGSGNGVGQSSTASLVQLVQTLDPYRLVNQASGGSYFGVGNVLDNHSYPQAGNPTSTTQAAVDGEFGGIEYKLAGHLWNPSQADGGYIPAATPADIAPNYDSLLNNVLEYKSAGTLNGAIYTQITDVENECNGLLTYDRIVKPDPTLIAYSNEKTVTGQIKITTILPTSQSQNRTWKYTTNSSTANTNWYAPGFNDSAWNSGLAPLGQGDPGVVTPWTTSDIWIRQHFVLGNIALAELSTLVFNVFYDEGCEIYLNGVLAASTTGYVTSYTFVPMNAAGQGALIPNATNLIAIHCVQTTGGQEIDAGISTETLTANTLTVPMDYVGYWPLNETNGTTAADLSVNTNNGTVTGATWNSQGKLGGCLAFNGVNNYVQVSNVISNDFSIVFWVNTTATGGTGTWWQGLGLVDGTTGSNANDFGTALIGNSLAFGTGHPDTTIVSATPINDGTWHHCTATRTQSSGLMQLYVDGALQATGTGSTNALTAPAFLRFGSIQTGIGYFAGNLDDIRLYGRALGSLEVAALYESGISNAAPPTNVTAAASSGQVVMSWWESPLASSYNVSRSTNSGGPYSIIANVTTPGYTDTNVVNGTTYYYVISAVDASGTGSNSSEVKATPFNLAAWFKADAINGLTNGSPIPTWVDYSGNGFNATQSNASQQPTYVTNAINGLPVVRFNSAASSYLSFTRPVQDDFTITFVFQSKQGSGTSTWYYNGAGLVNGEVAGVINDFGTSLNANGQICAGTGSPDTPIYSGNGYNDGKPHIVTFERTETNGLIALYADSALVATATGGTESLTAPSVLTLGCIQTLIGFLSGDLAEVRIYNSVLQPSDRQLLETALRVKYVGRPSLAVASANIDGITLSWTTNGSFMLYSATNLTPPVTWDSVNATPLVSNGTNTVSVGATNAARFFQLISQ